MTPHFPRINLLVADAAVNEDQRAGIDPPIPNADAENLNSGRCSRCGGGLIRVHRRMVDRLWSVLVPVRRFRCSRMHCGREGNRTITAGPTRYAWTAFVLSLAATTAGALAFTGYSHPTSHEPAVANGSGIDVSPPSHSPEPAPGVLSAVAPLQSPVELSEPLPLFPLQSIGPSDYASSFLAPTMGGRGADPGSADLNGAIRALPAEHR